MLIQCGHMLAAVTSLHAQSVESRNSSQTPPQLQLIGQQHALLLSGRELHMVCWYSLSTCVHCLCGAVVLFCQAVRLGLSGFGAGMSIGRALIEEQACLLNGLLNYSSSLLGSPCECQV